MPYLLLLQDCNVAGENGFLYVTLFYAILIQFCGSFKLIGSVS